MRLKLSVGDTVVVPTMGVGVVDAKERVDVGDVSINAYRIDLGEDEGTFWIPVDQLGSHGLREPISKDQLARLWASMLEQEAPAKRANWNRRRKRYQEMLASNEALQLAALVGELSAVAAVKKTKKQTLSFGERQLLDKAQSLLAQEVAAARDCEIDEVLDEMARRLAETDA
jgi:CarD family transcriptional regulator